MAAMTRPALAALLLIAGCDSDPPAPLGSADLSADAISLSAMLRSNGGLAQILVSPRHEYQTVELTGGDELRFAPAGGPEQRLTLFEGSYLGQLETGAIDFDLIFVRGGGERIESPITLPPHFALAAPAGPVSRAATIPITWDAAEGVFSVLLEIDGACLTQRIVRPFASDIGAYDVQPADLFVADGAAGCDLEVRVTRSGVDEDLAPELAASTAQVLQIRAVTVTTVP
jgi:hypothetical protein